MKIAILADIHGNDLALKTVLKDTLNFDISSFFYLKTNTIFGDCWVDSCICFFPIPGKSSI